MKSESGLLLNDELEKNMRYAIIVLSILLGAATPAMSQVSVGISVPGVSIGINQPAYPELVLVPGYPVYYAPRARVNYFFYDGLYWVYHRDRWYASTWYNGPWDEMDPDDVPLFVLRVPVRYYVSPPVYFRGWVVEAPPLWHVHWGPRWTHYRPGWEHWDRHAVHHPAPLPVYQRQYAGERYPRIEQQRELRINHYHYQPQNVVVRQHFERQQKAQPRPQSVADRPRPQRVQPSRNEGRRGEAPAVAQPAPQQRAPAVPGAEPQRRERENRQVPAQTVPQQQPVRPPVQEQRPQQRPRAEQHVQPQQQMEPRVQQAPRPQQVPRAQQAPRPQQAREHGSGRGDHQRGNAERHQGQERGQDRGQGRQ